MARLDFAIEQISFARRYTLRLLDQVNPDEWFQRPGGGVSHIAWQVGHLAMAEYRLAVESIRGRQPRDSDLVTAEFLAHFAIESTPVFDPAKYPAQAEICAVFHRVHEQVLRELPGLDDTVLSERLADPFTMAKTKYQALLWCAQHEMVHAGQIGLLRRELGRPPVW
jgi:uncharacterized damage-inducible protein DinB